MRVLSWVLAFVILFPFVYSFAFSAKETPTPLTSVSTNKKTGFKSDKTFVNVISGSSENVVYGTDYQSAAASLSLSASSAVLIEADSGRIIYEKDAHTERPMASTTKIMTALVALENSSLDRVVTVSKGAVGIEGSSMYLYAEEKLSMQDLLYALLLESANDAAAAIAFEVAGSIDAFAEMMNLKADELGLEHTSFTNPHGLDDEKHFTTAYDLAQIARAAMKNSDFREIVSTYRFVIENEDTGLSRLLINHNRLIRSYEGAVGVKTGYTKRSGRCLVSAAERDGVKLIAVTLNAPDDWNDHRALLDLGFSLYESVTLTVAGEQYMVLPVVGGESDYVASSNAEALSVTLPKGEYSISHTVEMKRFYYAPISEGEVLGRVVWYNNGEMIGSVDITAENEIPKKQIKPSLWERITGFFSGLIWKE